MDSGVAIVKVDKPDDVEDSELHIRAVQGWRCAWTNAFVALVDNSECGLLMLDLYESSLTAKIYEIFVLKRYRQRRIASALLAHAQVAARGFGARAIELDVHPLDRVPDKKLSSGVVFKERVREQVKQFR